jgi:hypothetical protein
VRFWNMLPQETGELALQYGPDSAPTVLAGGDPGNFSAGYIPVKPGRYDLKVVRTADPKTPLKSFDLVLRADVYVTFLAQVKDRQLSIEMLDDTYNRKEAANGRLVVRHFLPGAKISVTAAGVKSVGPLTEGGTEVLDALPLRPVVFQMKAALSDGRTRDWSMELDFRNCRHASLLLSLDPYGRFRPRLSPDGQLDFSDPEAVPVPQ